jgi:hypothetical protein
LKSSSAWQDIIFDTGGSSLVFGFPHHPPKVHTGQVQWPQMSLAAIHVNPYMIWGPSHHTSLTVYPAIHRRQSIHTCFVQYCDPSLRQRAESRNRHVVAQVSQASTLWTSARLSDDGSAFLHTGRRQYLDRIVLKASLDATPVSNPQKIHYPHSSPSSPSLVHANRRPAQPAHVLHLGLADLDDLTCAAPKSL